MPGRNREPVDLILTKGKYHISKDEIEKRRNEELKIISKDFETPSFLPQKLKKRFKKYAEMLSDLGQDIFTDLDSDCLARYVVAEELYEKYTAELNKLIKSNAIDKWLLLAKIEDDDLRDLIERILRRQKGDDMSVLLNQQDKVFKQAQSCARELGMTVTSRCKIVIPAPPDEDDEL